MDQWDREFLSYLNFIMIIYIVINQLTYLIYYKTKNKEYTLQISLPTLSKFNENLLKIIDKLFSWIKFIIF